MNDTNYDKYSNEYTQETLAKKLKNNTVKAGKKLVYVVLLLYYTLQKSNVPLKAKTAIIGALGYFIVPIDVIPDFLPMIGLTDDFGALMIALATVYRYIDDEVKRTANLKLEHWFGKGSDGDINEINAKI